MGKNIIILNGSPRKNGNTSTLINEFTKGAEKFQNVVTTFFLDEMNINGCKGCFKGGKDKDSPCVQKDDMEKIYPVFKTADIVVLASPLYYWTFSGQLRTAIDRLYAVVESDPNGGMPEKEAILLMAAEGYGFNDVIAYYNSLLKHIGWKDIGKVLAGGVKKIGDIEDNLVLHEAYLLGEQIK